MLKPGDIAIVSGARTPFGRYCGKLKDFTAQELGAVAAKAAIERAGIDAKEVGDLLGRVTFGHALDAETPTILQDSGRACGSHAGKPSKQHAERALFT